MSLSIQQQLAKWRSSIQQQITGLPAAATAAPTASPQRFALNRSRASSDGVARAAQPASSSSSSSSSSSTTSSTTAAAAPRQSEATVCPFCFAALESAAALAHLDSGDCAALTRSTGGDGDSQLDESQFAELSSDVSFWDRLERLHLNGYLPPLVADAVPTVTVLDEAAPSVGATLVVPAEKRSPQTLQQVLAAFRGVLRVKAAEFRARADSEAQADAFVTALVAGVVVATLDADPRLGHDAATRSRTLMFAGDESNAYSLGFEFDWIEVRGREFRDVRARFFGGAAATELAYCESLHSGLVPAASSGKSKAAFFKTKDARLMIKSIKAEEFDALLTVSDAWMAHIQQHPNTLLVAVLGLYIVQTERTTVHFCVMENVGCGVVPLEVMDLKGSLVGRRTNQRADAFDFEVVRDELADTTPSAPTTAGGGGPPLLKDADVLERHGQVLRFGPTLRECFLQQIMHDALFLGDVAGLMDYSLLVLVADPAQVAMHASSLSFAPNERSAFRRFNGAVVGSDEQDRALDSVCYFLAIIDFGQPYSVRKRLETVAKSLVHETSELSSVEPRFYANRFIQFMERITAPTPPQQQQQNTVP